MKLLKQLKIFLDGPILEAFLVGVGNLGRAF